MKSCKSYSVILKLFPIRMAFNSPSFINSRILLYRSRSIFETSFGVRSEVILFIRESYLSSRHPNWASNWTYFISPIIACFHIRFQTCSLRVPCDSSFQFSVSSFPYSFKTRFNTSNFCGLPDGFPLMITTLELCVVWIFSRFIVANGRFIYFFW